MKWFRKKSKSLLSKNLVGMLSVSLSVLVVVAVILFSWFRSQLVSGYHDLTRASIENTDTVFCRIIADTKNMTMDWYTSPDGIALRLNEDADFTDHMSFINKILSSLRSTTYIQSVCFINRQKKMVLNIGGSSLSIPEKLDTVLVDKIESINARTVPFCWEVNNYVSNHETIPLLSIPMSEIAVSDSEFTGMVVTNIDLNFLNKSMFSENEREFRIIILDSSGMVVGNSDLENLGENWSNQEWVQKVLSGEAQFELKVDNKRWEFMSIPARQEGFYIIAQSDYLTQVMNVAQVLNLVSGVILIAAMVLVFLMIAMSRRIFAPFTRMIEKLRKSEIAEEIVKEINEVAFLEHFYQGISTHIEALNEKKEKDFIVKNLLLGNRKEEVQLLLQQKGIIANNYPYYMIEGYVENKEDADDLSMREYDMLRNMVSGVFSSILEQYGHCTYFEVGLRRMLFILSVETNYKSDDGKILDVVKCAKKSSQKMSNSRIFTMILYCSSEGSDCISGFRKIDECLKTRRLLGYEEAAVLPEETEVFLDDYIDAIAVCLKKRDKTEYMKTIEEVLSACELLPFEEFAAKLEQIALVVLKTGGMKRKLEKGQDGKALLKEGISSLGEREEVMLWMESLYDEAVLQISKVNNHSTAKMMEEAIDYIRNNYDDCDLNVNLLANKLNITASYFGKLFTEFTGAKMSDYILEVRMGKARDLLLTEPNKDIGWVAVAVGYSNSNYFATLFKKYYGVTPSKFRDYYASKRGMSQEIE